MNQVKWNGDPPRAFIYVKHPVRKKTVCFALGLASEATGNLEKLNAVYMDDSLHMNPPQDKLPARLWQQWVGPDGVLKYHTKTGKTTKGGKLHPGSKEVAILQAEIDELIRDRETLMRKIEQQGRELEALRGAKYRKGTFPTLGDAKTAYIAAYTGRDKNHTNNVSWDLDRFVQKFGSRTKSDDMVGREGEINTWIRSLKVGEKYIGPSRRMFIRTYVLAMLKHAGVVLDGKKIERPKKQEVRKHAAQFAG
ncbi:MAG TPA: hypothetical protein VEJ63_24425 [Planctomycetota bacterium]|nr:hypothetical protein [Planctomycetota bacterium]